MGSRRAQQGNHSATVIRVSAWIAVAVSVAALCPQTARAGRRVTVTREMIAAVGATRLSDVLVLVDSWAPQSNDGYTMSLTPRALALPRDTHTPLYLNGQRLDVSVFDAEHLELIPVTLCEIDSLVFSDESAPGASWDGGRGRIEIFASRARAGWSAGGAASAAHKSGDGATTIGPDGSLWLARGAGGWFAALSASLAEHPYDDPAMRARTTAAMQERLPGVSEPESGATSWFYDPQSPALLRLSASLRGGVRAGGHWHEGVVSLQNARRYFHYSEPFGRELPTDQHLAAASLSGGADVAPALTLGYRASLSESQLSDQDGVLAFDYDWRVRRSRAGVDAVRAGKKSRVTLFASVENRRVFSGDTLSRNEDTFVRSGLSVARRLGRRSIAGADAAGTFSGGDGAASFGVCAGWVPRDADTLRVRVRRAQRLFVEDDNLWLWSERGYRLLEENGVLYSIDGPVTRTTVSSADVGWTSSGVMGGVDVDLGVRRFDDAYVEQRRFTYDDATCSFVSPTDIATGRTGHVGVVHARLWHALGARSWADFSWMYHEEFTSDPEFSALWQTVPRHRVSYSLYGRLWQSWRLRVRIAHASSTFWPDYVGADGATCTTDGVTVTYRAHVPAYTTVDAGVQFFPWKDRAVFDLVARNLFDTTLRDHPTGASQPFTIGVQVCVRLGAQ